MEIRSAYARCPLVTMLCAFALAGVCSGVARGDDLVSQVTSTFLAATATMLLARLLVPQALGGNDSNSSPRVFHVKHYALLMLAAVVGGAWSVAGGAADGAFSLSGEEFAARCLLALLLCTVTAIFEEGLFRGITIPCALAAFRRKNVSRETSAAPSAALRAAIFSAAVFGILHVAGSLDAVISSLAAGLTSVPAPSSASETLAGSAACVSVAAELGSSSAEALAASSSFASAITLAVHALLKALQAGLFGFCMAAMFLETGSLRQPVAAHAAFDVLYLGPSLVTSRGVPTTYLTGSCGDLAVLALTVALLLPPSVKSARWLAHEVVTYSSFHE